MFFIRYARFWEFGLYEDDLTIIPRAMQMGFVEVIRYIGFYIINLYGHARPLSDSLIYLFSNLGWRLGGFHGPYIFGYLFVTLNAVLFYTFLRRLRPGFFALAGALAYVFFSADTTQAFLTHSLGLHPSLTLLLMGFHAYLSKRIGLAYSLVFVILFSYETPFLVFLAAPLLPAALAAKNLSRETFFKLVRHGLILGVILVAVFALRWSVGEGRVSGLSGLDLITIPLTHMLQGPIVSLGTYFLRPIQALQNLSLDVLLMMVGAFPFLFWFLSSSQDSQPGSPAEPPLPSKPVKSLRALASPVFQSIASLRSLFAAGFIMLVMAYPLTFTVRAYAISGRDTRVHAAAVVGAALLGACASAVLEETARHFGKKRLASLLLSGLFALLAGYGALIQKDYVAGWALQRDFWRELTPLIADVEEGTVVFIEPSGLVNPRQIDANTWNLPRILNQLYIFPADWKNPPRVYRLAENWQNHLVTDDGNFQINVLTSVAPPSLYGQFAPAQVIFIHTDSGRLVRRDTPLPLGDQQFALKSQGQDNLSALETGFLYALMFEK
jgi:hypothetical protein